MTTASKVRPVVAPYASVWLSATAHGAMAFAAERSRWGLWLPVFLGAGIVVYFLLDAEPPSWSGPAALMAFAAMAVLCRSRPVLPLLLVGAVFAAAGFSAAQLRTWAVDAPVLERRTGPVTVIGTVLRVEPTGVAGAGHSRVTLAVDALGGLVRDRTPARVRVRVSQTDVALRPGDRVRMRAVLYPPSGPGAPGAFDFARRAYFQRLGGVGYSVRTPEVTGAANESSLSLAVARLRHALTGRILDALPGTAGAVAAALMTGERGAIPEETLKAMRDSGLAHLLAISGLHIGLIGGFIFFVVRGGFAAWEHAALRWPIKKWAALAAFVGALAYLLISGATLPTQRAFLMLSLVLLAVVIDRNAISMNLVAWAAAMILLLEPESVLSVSFQMSFAAVIALVAFYETVTARRRWLERRGMMRRALVYLGAVLATTLIASLATGAFAAFHFNRLALLGILANLAAVPLTALWVMPFALLSFVLMPLGLEALPLAAMGWGIDGVLFIAHKVQSLPGSALLLPSAPGWALAAVALGGLWLCLWRTPWRYAGAAVVGIGLSGWLSVAPPDLLVSDDGKLVGIRTEEGALALPFGGRGIAIETWRRRAGLDPDEKGPEKGAVPGLRCDGIGCIYRTAGKTVALVRHRAALAEDCRAADILISTVPVRRWQCRGPQIVIGRFDLWRNGPHAVWIDGDRVRVENAASAQRRPWQVYPREARRRKAGS